MSENDLGSEGAIHIITYGVNLQVLHLGKNYIKADCGRALTNLLKKSKALKKLHLDFNELMVTGAKCIAQGL